MKTMKLITCLVLPILWSLGNATTNVREDQRNGVNAIVRCETDILYAVIIWYIGDKRSVADQIELNGRLATAMETIPVAETIQVTCIAQNRSTSENDTLALHPREVSADPPTVVTSLTTDADDGGPAITPAGTLPTSPNVSSNYGDENVTVEIPMPPSDQEDEQSTHIYVVIGIVGVIGVVVVVCFVAVALVAIAYCHKRVKPTSTPPEQTPHNSGVRGPQSQGLHVPDALHMCARALLNDSGSLATNPTDESKDSLPQCNPQKEEVATSSDFGPPPMLPNLDDLPSSSAQAPESNQWESDEDATTYLGMKEFTGDKQSVLRNVALVAPRPPPRRTQAHSSVQREYGNKDVPIGQMQVPPFHGDYEDQNQLQIGIVLEPKKTASSGSVA